MKKTEEQGNAGPIISVIVIVTKDDQFTKARTYIESQTVYSEVEIVPLKNYNNCNFSSAAKALNYGGKMAKGDILIFMHQDVYLHDPAALEKCKNFLLNNSLNTIIGAAGVCLSDGILHSDIYDADGKLFGPKLDGKIAEAVSLDECFLAMTKNTWQQMPFDEETCDDWHFYGVDISYTNMLRGGKNFIYPLNICHESGGNIYAKGFRKTLYRIIKKYNHQVDKLLTPCVQVPCSSVGFLKFLIKLKLRKY